MTQCIELGATDNPDSPQSHHPSLYAKQVSRAVAAAELLVDRERQLS